MNVIVIDNDKSFLDFMDFSFSKLSICCFLFEDIDSFLEWNNANADVVVDFAFIAIYKNNEKGFSFSLEIKDILSKRCFLSVIFLLETHDNSHYIKSIKYGDGYLLKPFNEELLLSIINYHSKRSTLNGMLAEKNKRLSEYKSLTIQEYTIVEKIFSRQCESHLVVSDNIRFHISPVSVFNGDVLLTAQSPSGSLYVAVGDVTGHGLPAAIGAMPVYSTFRAMAKKGKSIGLIAIEMNKVLRGLLPDNMMMALSIMELDFSHGKAFIWSGGMPDIIAIDSTGTIKQKIISRHAPLAVLDPDRFRRDVDVISLEDGDRLFFYTDGIEEARSVHGEMFGIERFQALFNHAPDTIFDNIIASHKDFIADNEQNDDITLVEIRYQPELNYAIPPPDFVSSPTPAIPWRMEFRLNPSELRETDAVAQIISFFDSALDLNVHQDCISTVLAELYSNALEHGLLELNSALKHSDDGFVDYYIERQQRLAELKEGRITIVAEYRVVPPHNNGLLTLEITDSGKGFNYEAINSLSAAKANAYGRGIGLLKELCSDVTYSNNGRTVIASYYINR